MTTKTNIVFAILFAITMTITLPNAFAEKTLDLTTEEDQECWSNMQEYSTKTVEQLQQAQHAIFKQVAENSSFFKNEVDLTDFELVGITNARDMNVDDCTTTLTSSNLHYKTIDENGNKKSVRIEVDAKTYEILDTKAELTKDRRSHASTNQNANWAGYAFNGNSGATEEVVQAAMTYNVPTPNDPTDFNCGSGSDGCFASIWTGLSTAENGEPMIQAGTDSECYGNNCTSRDYTGWIEDINSSGDSDELYECPSGWQSYLSAGDSMLVQVTNDEKTTGSNDDDYDAFVVNITDNEQCDNLNIQGSINPTYGQFIYERLTWSGLTKLAQISDVSGVYGTVWYDGSNHGITTPYSNGWYVNYEMWNDDPANPGADKNADGTKQAGSYITFDWITSEGTD